jgi:hypothetical protein
MDEEDRSDGKPAHSLHAADIFAIAAAQFEGIATPLPNARHGFSERHLRLPAKGEVDERIHCRRADALERHAIAMS